jgi:hypothetical protein
MTKTSYNDPLWEHFIPVWSNLEELGCNACLIGGYALALKQRWLLESRGISTLVDKDLWPISRVTQDLDVVFPIRVIGDQEKNPGIERTLTGLGWIPHREHGNWTYIKSIKGFAEPIKFELHTPIPPPDASSSNHVRIPHPLSLCMMKLISEADRYKRSQRLNTAPEKLELQLFQARKHAGDVGRSIAMLLREEMNSMDKVRECVQQTEPFQKACKILQADFIPTDGWAHLFLSQPQLRLTGSPPRN